MADRSISAQHADWLAFIGKLRAQLACLGPHAVREPVVAEPAIRLEDTLRVAEAAGSRGQAQYQRRMSSLMAGRPLDDDVMA